MPEEWRDIAGYEGRYQVSNLGRVKSLARCFKMGTNNICREDQIMKQQAHAGRGSSYSVVWLRMPGQHRKFFVHRLVATAFLPNPESKPIVNHRDRDQRNNGVSNLEWMTYSENTQHWMQEEAF